MTPDELEAELDALPPGQVPAMASLARRVRGEALALPNAALRRAESADAGRVLAARHLVGELDDLTIRAILDAASPPSIEHQVWRLGTAVAAIVSLRARARQSGCARRSETGAWCRSSPILRTSKSSRTHGGCATRRT